MKAEEILVTIMDSHRHSIDYRRELQFKSFSWATTLFVAILAGIISLISKPVMVPIVVPILITISSLAITIAYIKFLKLCRSSINRNARNIVPIEEELGLFTSGALIPKKQLYKEKSKEWGSKIEASPESFFYYSTVIILGLTVIILSWNIGITK